MKLIAARRQCAGDNAETSHPRSVEGKQKPQVGEPAVELIPGDVADCVCEDVSEEERELDDKIDLQVKCGAKAKESAPTDGVLRSTRERSGGECSKGSTTWM